MSTMSKIKNKAESSTEESQQERADLNQDPG